ncbi:hypothetical protein K461DRAFT_156315 [Myriangium duriaei CBS 260.36]|uniref:Uncharacterized protein n=1 Tax=Myriangium duriaei CBS 260.36 TaxID=1168546 RepID=A0A9P4J0A5_9PEZI|nr:hypothetical protein K461DRAFT_156315 [Myriangium duriaei CBS 260.36]
MQLSLCCLLRKVIRQTMVGPMWSYGQGRAVGRMQGTIAQRPTITRVTTVPCRTTRQSLVHDSVLSKRQTPAAESSAQSDPPVVSASALTGMRSLQPTPFSTILQICSVKSTQSQQDSAAAMSTIDMSLITTSRSAGVWTRRGAFWVMQR